MATQYSCLENPMDRGAWQAAVQGVTKSGTRLSDFNFTFTFTQISKGNQQHPNSLGLVSSGARIGIQWAETRGAAKLPAVIVQHLPTPNREFLVQNVSSAEVKTLPQSEMVCIAFCISQLHLFGFFLKMLICQQKHKSSC